MRFTQSFATQLTISGTDSRQARGLSLLLFLAMLGVFTAARSWDAYPLVFQDSGQVRLLGADSWFHARHAEYSRNNFPSLLRNDAFARYPKHGRQSVSGLFNLGIGGVAAGLSFFSANPFPVEPVAAWAPVFLAGLAFLLLYVIGLRLGGIRIGLGACAVFLLFPGTALTRSTLGFADQHVLEFLLALGSIGGLVLCLSREWSGQESSWRPAFLYAAPFAAFFYSWLGAPVYIPLLAAAVFTGMMGAVAARQDVMQLGKGLYRFFGAVVAYQVFVLLLVPDWVMGTGVKWWILTGLATLAALPWLYFRLLQRIGALERPWLTVLVTVIVFACAVFVFFAYTKQGRGFYGQMTGIRGDRVSEQGDVLWIDLWNRFGVPGILAALSPLLLIFSRQSAPNRLLRLMVCVFGWGLFLLWVRTHDFDYAPPILIALMAALGADDLIRWIAGSTTRWLGPPARSAVGLILAGALLAPFGINYNWWQTSDRAGSMVRHKSAWFGAMKWLAENSPQTDLQPNTQVTDTSAYQTAYGVMSSWDDGNFVAHAGQRPAIVSRFPGSRDGLWLSATTEEASIEPLCPDCRGQERARYAVVTAQLASRLFPAKAFAANRPADVQVEGYWMMGEERVPHMTFGPGYSDSIVKRLVRDGGRGLHRYRLVYESPERAALFTVYRPAATKIVMDWMPTDTEQGQQFLTSILDQTVVPIPGGFIYDFATVPQVMIYEILGASE